jgi:hypothetical protein
MKSRSSSCTSRIVCGQLRKGRPPFSVRLIDTAGNTGEDTQEKTIYWTVNPIAVAAGADKRSLATSPNDSSIVAEKIRNSRRKRRRRRLANTAGGTPQLHN